VALLKHWTRADVFGQPGASDEGYAEKGTVRKLGSVTVLPLAAGDLRIPSTEIEELP
jgi:hypothetical protein